MRSREGFRLGLMAFIFLASLAGGRLAMGQFSSANFRGFVAPDGTAIGINSTGNTVGTWYGGDLGSMALLPNGTMFVGFCDPDIGPGPNNYPAGVSPFDYNPPGSDPYNVRQGNYAPMGNSIAIMTAAGNQTHVQHYFRGNTGTYGNTQSYQGQAFFPILEPPANYPLLAQYNAANAQYNARIWVRKPIVVGTSLYVFGNFVTNPSSSSGINNVENTLIMRVTNPTASPAAWDIDYLTVGIFNSAAKHGFPTWATNQPAPCFFGNEAFTTGDGYLYTYGTYYPGYTGPNNNLFSGFTVFPMRIPIADLENAASNADVSANAQYFTTGRVWQAGLYDPSGANMLVVGDQTDFASLAYSIRPNDTLGVWQAVFNYEAVMASRTEGSTDPRGYSAYIKTSQYPYGPWSTPQPLFAYPGLSQASTDSHGNPIVININQDYQCYAVREVPALEPSDSDVSLVFTTLDASDPSSWASNYSMYVPLEYDTPNPLAGNGGDDAMRAMKAFGKFATPPPSRPRTSSKVLKVRPGPRTTISPATPAVDHR